MENDNISSGESEILGGLDSAPVRRPDTNEKVQQLIDRSKEKGFVTVQDINEVVPDAAAGAEHGVRPHLLASAPNNG
jgi:Sigma-70 factor, region 1.1